MLQPGTLTSAGDWGESASMARAIESAMVSEGLLDLDDETADARAQRRRSFVALARGIVDHVKASMTLTFAAGDLRASGDGTGALVPTATKTLTGKVS